MLIGAATIELPIALRYFVPLVPVAYIIVAYGAGKVALQLGQRFSAGVEPSYLYIASALVMVTAVGGFASVSWADELEQTGKHQWREVAAELEAQAMEGDIFYIYPPRLLRYVNFYSPQAISTVTRTPLSQPTCSKGRVWVVGMRRSGGGDVVSLLREQGCLQIESISFVGGISLNLLGASEGVLSGGIFPRCDDLRPTIIGTVEDDLLNGTPGPDVIHGLSGNDTINGLGGDDVLCGGRGNDKLNGGEGNDTLLGGVGNDILNAGDGDDSMWGGPGDDALNAGVGSDLLIGGQGSDQLRGGVGDLPDRLEGVLVMMTLSAAVATISFAEVKAWTASTAAHELTIVLI